jgi:hypothetical protein
VLYSRKLPKVPDRSSLPNISHQQGDNCAPQQRSRVVPIGLTGVAALRLAPPQGIFAPLYWRRADVLL